MTTLSKHKSNIKQVSHRLHDQQNGYKSIFIWKTDTVTISVQLYLKLMAKQGLTTDMNHSRHLIPDVIICHKDMNVKQLKASSKGATGSIFMPLA